jgi:hypothetical protein
MSQQALAGCASGCRAGTARRLAPARRTVSARGAAVERLLEASTQPDPGGVILSRHRVNARPGWRIVDRSPAGAAVLSGQPLDGGSRLAALGIARSGLRVLKPRNTRPVGTARDPRGRPSRLARPRAPRPIRSELPLVKLHSPPRLGPALMPPGCSCISMTSPQCPQRSRGHSTTCRRAQPPVTPSTLHADQESVPGPDQEPTAGRRGIVRDAGR